MLFTGHAGLKYDSGLDAGWLDTLPSNRLTVMDPGSNCNESTRVSMRTAYVTTCFPSMVETFVRDELHALNEGEPRIEQIISLRKGVVPQLQDPEIVDARDPLQAMFPFLRAVIGHPLRFLVVVLEAIRLDWRDAFNLEAGRSSLIKSLLLLPLILELDGRVHPDTRHYHAHFAGVATTVACLLAVWRRGTFSFTAHGSDLHVYPPRNLARRIMLCRFCVTVSEYNRRYLLNVTNGRFSDRIHVIHCGIRTARFACNAQRTVPQVPRLLCVARLDPIKGLSHFIEALAIHRDAGAPRLVFDLAGDGPERDRLQLLVVEKGLQEWVRFHGFVTPEAVSLLLHECDAFVLPSLSEGFPVVLMEAATARLPLIASRITGIPEILKEHYNGRFLTPANPDQQAAVLAEISSQDWAELKRLTAGAAELDLTDFKLETTSSRLKSLLWPDQDTVVPRP